MRTANLMYINQTTTTNGRIVPTEAREVRDLFQAGYAPGRCPETLLGSILIAGKSQGKCYADEVRALGPQLIESTAGPRLLSATL